MELLQLKYFCDAAKTQNFSKTAEKFEVPPSCISQSIKRLENELSVKLFTRSANKISLNSKGIEFYEKVSTGLNYINNAANSVKDDGKKGEINICINSNRRLVMQAIKKFQSIFPKVNIVTRHLTDHSSDNFDIIISRDNILNKAFNKMKLLSEPLCVAINKNNPLATQPNFNLSMLADQPFISTDKQSKLYELTQVICNKYGFEPNIVLLSDDTYYVRKHVELNLAVTLAPAFSWYGLFDDSVLLYPSDNCMYDTYIYTNSEKYISVCTKNFIKFLINECRDEYKAADFSIHQQS